MLAFITQIKKKSTAITIERFLLLFSGQFLPSTPSYPSIFSRRVIKVKLHGLDK
jgi:hypothetical protein